MEEHSFGYWLKLKRKALDLTREGLAERVGYSAETIRKLETEERRPSAQMVERLAEIFHIPRDEKEAFLRFARGDWRSAPSEAQEDTPWQVAAKTTPSNLPAKTTSLIGREKDIALVREYLTNDEKRLVTLIGPPGIGKTRLSIEAARASVSDFPDGVFFVALAPLDDPNLIPFIIAQMLGYVGARNISTIDQLKEGIGDKNMLLVLDNCEHLIVAVASLASELLSACSHLKILVTSREALRIPGEWLYTVPAFDLPVDRSSLNMESASKYPALTLFVERARAIRSDFSLNADNIETVAAICAHLDGLPLVIELIAARIRLMSPQALLERLSARFVLTADGMRAASERQKTLRNAIDWSYNLLPPEEQKLFAYLSVFSGSFTLEAVEARFSQKFTEKPLPDLIALLLDKSLLKRASHLEEHGETRYTMLVTIQEYARERLQEMGEAAEVCNAHLAYFLDLAEKADKEVRGHNQLEWLRRLQSDRDNLRAALDWAIETGQTEQALQMACNLHWFWFVRGDHTEGREWLKRVLELPESARFPESQAEALTQLAHHTWLQIGAKEARPLVEEALSVARGHDDKRNMARALTILGLVLTDENDFVAARSTLEESKALFQEIEDIWGFAHALMGLALESFKEDDQAGSLALHEQALMLFREVGDQYFQCAAQRWIGLLQGMTGDETNGMAALGEALILGQQLESKFEIGVVLSWWGEAEKRSGHSARAVCLYWAAKNILQSISAWGDTDEAQFEIDIAPCRAALGESAFAEAVQQGRAMTMEQAIAYALEDSGS
jgi:predicted ATPase/DNA-binding XRE family transcriptional regulator